MPREFWAKAIACVEYFINRSPSKSLQNLTPHEAWYGSKPSIGHLRIFGSPAYVHIPDAVRTKLDNKAEKCIFIGYSERSKAYKYFNPMTKKIAISRDVKFDESVAFKGSNKSTSTIIYEEENISR